MEIEQIQLYFGIFVAFTYGLLIGSFLNVCIYRLPPRLYVFDDLFEPPLTFIDHLPFSELIRNFFKKTEDKEKESSIEMRESLYVEGIWLSTLSPTGAFYSSLFHTFNLYKANFPETVTIVKPRSFCPHCRNMIRWWMNIPLLSYLFLGGKCYYCKAPISPRYWFNELLSGLLCGYLFYLYGLTPQFFLLYILVCLCIVIFYIDLEHWLILDELTVPFTFVGIFGSLFVPYKFFVPQPDILGLSFLVGKPGIVVWFENIVKNSPPWLHPDSFLQTLSASVGGFIILWAIGVVGTVLARREAMGGGDIKFAMLMGAFLGIQKGVLAFFLSVVIGTLILLPLLLIGRRTGKDQIPFGCFLTIATVITALWGDKIIDLYLRLPGLFVDF